VHVESQVPLGHQAGRCGGCEVGVDGADQVARAAVVQDLRDVPQRTHVN
jgi:hypothetical protein